MNCDDVREHLPEYWSGELEPAAAREFAAHLDRCETCRQEADSLGAIWAKLGLLPAESPGSEMRSRFYEALEAYRQGMEAAGQVRSHSLKAFFDRYWPKRPALQFAVSAACLIVGLGAGYSIHNARGNAGVSATPANGEVAQLRDEIENMRQLVALSLLRQSSPAERMKGVDWSNRVPQSDTEVLAALLYTVNHDDNVNVRLSAVDALRYFAASPVARNGLRQAIPRQSSPLVQIALIDLGVDLRDAQSVPVLEAVAQQTGVNPEVRERARWALEKLK